MVDVRRPVRRHPSRPEAIRLSHVLGAGIRVLDPGISIVMSDC